MRQSLLILAITIMIASSASAQVPVVQAFPNLTFTYPVLVTNAGDCTNRIFVLQQNGLIRVFRNDSTATTGSVSTFLNISAKLSSGGGGGSEEGLLGLAFHPDYENNGYFYVNYTAPSPRRTIIARYSVMPGNPNKADSLSEQILMSIYQPYSNHNGGMLTFGNDGYLYIGSGDGGSGGDPGNRAQNLDSLLGKILRIDVDTTTGYKIPPTNPLVGIAGRDEIFAWGMRNPWRGSSDPVTGQIWWGDVGQGAWEEVDLIENGKNYGWRCYEGNAAYDLSGCGSPSLYTFPVKDYSSSSPNPECTVVGGYVYRGSRRPELYGYYIYGDYCSGKISRFKYNGGPISGDSTTATAGFLISSFGTDEAGELYICQIATTGRIYRFGGVPTTISTTLSSPADDTTDLTVPVTLSWECVQGAMRYRIEVDDDPLFGSPAIVDSTYPEQRSYVASSLAQGVQYYWRVRVKNPGGWGSYSSVWDFTTLAPFPPAAPSLVSPADLSIEHPLSLSLVWNDAATATSYRLQVSTDSLFGSFVVDDSTLTDTSSVVSGLAYATEYFWRVSGKNTAGEGAYSTVWRFTTLVPTAPAAPALASPADVSVDQATTLTLTWLTTNGADSYRLQVSEDSLFGTLIVDDSTLTDTSMQVSGLSIGETYYWRVSATNFVGTSPFSSTWSFTTTTLVTNQYSVVPGWNLVSSPLSFNDPRKTTLYPSAISPAFTFSASSGYLQSDSLLNGVGYWLKFADDDTVALTGNVVFSDTIPVVVGWNMIGPISSSVDTSTIVQDPPGLLISPFYEYNASYSAVSSLEPGKGYWVKCSSDGNIILSSGPSPVARPAKPQEAPQSIPKGETR